jgi:hypothetical protein
MTTFNPMTHTPEQLRKAHRWMGALPRDQFDMFLLLLREREAAAIVAAEAETTEKAAKLCEAQQQIFLSDEYSTGQPFSSFGERFACGQIAAALRANEHLREPSAS